MQIEIGRGKFFRHDLVDQILDPLLGRLEALFLGLRRMVLRGGAVHHLGGPLRRPAECSRFTSKRLHSDFSRRHDLFGKPASTFPDHA
jgi:hypothetical protein